MNPSPPNPSSPAIEVAGLVKQYGQIQALKGVHFKVAPNSVFCILGPNGAGKTTLLKILTTITRPDQGTATITGHDILSHPLQVRQNIGVVFQENHFDRYLSIWHNLLLHTQMHGIPTKVSHALISEKLKAVGLYDRRHQDPDSLSGGMRRRLALIRALLHQPHILFLDEPSTGLDPKARREMWDAIITLKQESTVILTTHYMEEADVLSDRILILHQGQVLNEDTPKALKQSISPAHLYDVELDTNQLEAYAHQFTKQGIPCEILSEPARLRLTINTPHAFKTALNLLEMETLHRIGQVEADLEDVFLSIGNEPHKEVL